MSKRDVCDFCGQVGENVSRPLGMKDGWKGGDAAPSGRFLVTIPGVTTTSKGRTFINARLHAFHEVELGETSRRRLGLHFERVISAGELAKLEARMAEK